MNRLFLVAVLCVLMLSCTKTPEDKADALIRNEIKKFLLYPDTYDPAETKVDSAFTPFDDPNCYNVILKISKLIENTNEYAQNLKLARNSMNIWSGPHQSAYARDKYISAEAEYNTNIKRIENATKQMKKLGDELNDISKNGKQFIGFKAIHRYRTKDNAGQIVFGEMEFLFDTNIDKIIESYNTSDEDYIKVKATFNWFLENAGKQIDNEFDLD